MGAASKFFTPTGGAVMALQNWGTLLLTATARQGLHGWDLRTERPAFALSGSPDQVSLHSQHLM